MLRLAGGGLLASLSGCATPERLAAVPRGRAQAATVLGIPNERFHPLLPSGAAGLEQEFLLAFDRLMRGAGKTAREEMPDYEALSVSGGGENGAFGAGLLCGWTEHGTRPTFNLVTGVSTGALTAPFAFLGSHYDPQLRSVYTDITLADVMVARYWGAALFDDALSDTSPLSRTISRHLDERMLAAIAARYEEGRLLLIGTSDIDAQLPVIWNVGAIAKSGRPEALETVRRIMLASAAIPGAFPPVMFDVTVDGERRQEMHVDGGAFSQAFLYPPFVTRQRRERMAKGLGVAGARAFVIRNARLDADWSSVERRTLGIAGRAINAMIFASGYNDILRMFGAARRDDIDFNLAVIGSDFTGEYKEPFEQAYMRALFDYGFQKGRGGYDWLKTPPNFA
jgi:predicted acylesterase/phospholipase RssA